MWTRFYIRLHNLSYLVYSTVLLQNKTNLFDNYSCVVEIPNRAHSLIFEWTRGAFHLATFFRPTVRDDERKEPQCKHSGSNGPPLEVHHFSLSYRLEWNGAFHLYNISIFNRDVERALAPSMSLMAYTNLSTNQNHASLPTDKNRSILTGKISRISNASFCVGLSPPPLQREPGLEGTTCPITCRLPLSTILSKCCKQTNKHTTRPRVLVWGRKGVIPDSLFTILLDEPLSHKDSRTSSTSTT